MCGLWGSSSGVLFGSFWFGLLFLFCVQTWGRAFVKQAGWQRTRGGHGWPRQIAATIFLSNVQNNGGPGFEISTFRQISTFNAKNNGGPGFEISTFGKFLHLMRKIMEVQGSKFLHSANFYI